MAASYATFSVLAAVHFPTAYSPLHNNTLSQLGNENLNPHGAIFYLIACALTGALAIGFFVSLSPWKLSGKPYQNHLLLLVQALGAIGGFGLIMNAVFPENNLPPHHFWAGVVFNAFGAAMLLAPLALRRPGLSNLGLTGVPLLGATAVIVMFVFARVHWVEWVPVTLFLLSPSMLGLHTMRVRAAPAVQPSIP